MAGRSPMAVHDTRRTGTRLRLIILALTQHLRHSLRQGGRLLIPLQLGQDLLVRSPSLTPKRPC